MVGTLKSVVFSYDKLKKKVYREIERLKNAEQHLDKNSISVLEEAISEFES